MKNILIIVTLAAFLFFINYINPKFDDHKSAISTETKLDTPLWKNLEYKDFFVASATSNAKTGSMVSIGFCKYVKVSDRKWFSRQN